VIILFVAAALYEGLLGAAFLFRGRALFQQFQVPPPNHSGYIQFPAALLIVFALMFLAILKDPEKQKPYSVRYWIEDILLRRDIFPLVRGRNSGDVEIFCTL